MNILLDLFLTFAKIGLFTFGGGYAMIAMIENNCVERKRWITHDEMMNVTVIAESTPGPIAVSASSANFQAIIITAVLVASMFGYKHFVEKKPSPILLIVISAAMGIVVYGI